MRRMRSGKRGAGSRSNQPFRCPVERHFSDGRPGAGRCGQDVGLHQIARIASVRFRDQSFCETKSNVPTAGAVTMGAILQAFLFRTRYSFFRREGLYGLARAAGWQPLPGSCGFRASFSFGRRPWGPLHSGAFRDFTVGRRRLAGRDLVLKVLSVDVRLGPFNITGHLRDA
jgi:hypothetical protein